MPFSPRSFSDDRHVWTRVEENNWRGEHVLTQATPDGEVRLESRVTFSINSPDQTISEATLLVTLPLGQLEAFGMATTRCEARFLNQSRRIGD